MKKKVLHIISSVNWRGGEQQVDFMFNNQSNEFDYYLFCPAGSELVKRNQSKSANIFTYKKHFGFDIFGGLELKKACTKKKIDLIHLHDSHAINTYLLADLFGMNIPAVIHRHVNFPVSFKWKYSYHKIKKIICVSEEVKRNLSSFIDEKKLIVIQPGISIDQWSMVNSQVENKLKQELNLSDETTIIGIISALEKEKNIDEFIEIANKLIKKNKGYHFVIIGDGSLSESCRQSKIDSRKNIHFLGFRNDVADLLNSFNVFLFTSKNEGFPLVLLEAMASKIPVVCNNFPSAKELIENEKTGFIYKDVNNATDSIEYLMMNDNLRNKITQNAHNFVKQFDVTLLNKKLEDLYLSLNIKH